MKRVALPVERIVAYERYERSKERREIHEDETFSRNVRSHYNAQRNDRSFASVDTKGSTPAEYQKFRLTKDDPSSYRSSPP